MKNTILSLIILNLFFVSNTIAQDLVFGVFADCQYCDTDTKGNRYYRNSLEKLDNCIKAFNETDQLNFTVGLGDLIDNDFKSFNDLKPTLQKSKVPIHHVIGNHDYSIEDNEIKLVPDQLNMPGRYYFFKKEGWYFIFLDGYELTTKAIDSKLKAETTRMLNKIKSEGKPNAHTWNGGISNKQLNWFENVLKDAKKQNSSAIVFCHYPIRPFSGHCLWNSDEVVAILENSGCVKAWFNGHNHDGNYTIENGIHYVNFKGMVETPNENAFSIISLFEDKIEINGFGREKDKDLQIK